ncbi:MAG: hypothetical protein H6813_02860 [Phycisphaeraceae bacterium]|nr:hypothetical protein [Phycisphaeraceae bacterium]MCB9848743.1 hypothetical protein [Phycisphaeraceae bacterium]
MIHLHLTTAWIAVLTGFVSGAVIGLGFHHAAFLGGYGSWPRRLLRLAHIACFGMAFVNLAFVLTLATVGDLPNSIFASPLLLVGTVGMPVVCALAAWRKPLRNLFPVPVLALLGAASLVCWDLLQEAAQGVTP